MNLFKVPESLSPFADAEPPTDDVNANESSSAGHATDVEFVARCLPGDRDDFGLWLPALVMIWECLRRRRGAIRQGGAINGG